MTTTEYRAIVNRDGTERPFWYIFPKPDVNWGRYFHDLQGFEVIRWEKREVTESAWSTQ